MKDEAPKGWLVTGYPWDSIKEPAHVKFVEAYRAKYNETPKIGSLMGYVTVQALAAVINKAQGTDTEKLITAARGLTFDTAMGPMTFRAIDQQSTMGLWVGKLDRQGQSRRHGRLAATSTARISSSMKRASRQSALPKRCDEPVGGVPAALRHQFARDRSVLDFPQFLAQFLSGVSYASTLFLVSSGLSVIYGVTRIVNFAHGSFFMVGAYVACSLTARLPATPFGFWTAMLLSGIAVGLAGIVMELLVLRRIYRAPELFQILATFGVILIVQNLVQLIWGTDEIFASRAPGLRGVVDIAGQAIPQYDLALIAIGPLVLVLIWLLLHKTRWGILVRAATQDREMTASLGINQSLLFTSVVFRRVLSCRIRGGAADPKGHREPADGPQYHHRGLRRGCDRRPRERGGRFPRGAADRPDPCLRHPGVPGRHPGDDLPADGHRARGEAVRLSRAG